MRKSSATRRRMATSKTLLGWRSYYGFSEVPNPPREVEKWIRHRLRCNLAARAGLLTQPLSRNSVRRRARMLEGKTYDGITLTYHPILNPDRGRYPIGPPRAHPQHALA